MIIFTPNTVIKSADMNTNLNDLKDRLDAIKILRVYFDNGTGTRSTTTSSSLANLPGATGDTSYTAPAGVDVDIVFTMTQMINMSGGSGGGRVFLRINSTNKTQGLYYDAISGGWQIQTIQYPKESVNAGNTITINAQWSTGSGTMTATNNNTDAQFPNEIIGIVLPRGI